MCTCYLVREGVKIQGEGGDVLSYSIFLNLLKNRPENGVFGEEKHYFQDKFADFCILRKFSINASIKARGGGGVFLPLPF